MGDSVDIPRIGLILSLLPMVRDLVISRVSFAPVFGGTVAGCAFAWRAYLAEFEASALA